MLSKLWYWSDDDANDGKREKERNWFLLLWVCGRFNYLFSFTQIVQALAGL